MSADGRAPSTPGTPRTSPTWSASSPRRESADINGQIFVVFGGNIYAMSAFQPAGEVTRDAAWTPEELIAAKGDLFKGIGSGVPDFSFI